MEQRIESICFLHLLLNSPAWLQDPPLLFQLTPFSSSSSSSFCLARYGGSHGGEKKLWRMQLGRQTVPPIPWKDGPSPRSPSNILLSLLLLSHRCCCSDLHFPCATWREDCPFFIMHNRQEVPLICKHFRSLSHVCKIWSTKHFFSVYFIRQEGYIT